MDDGGGGGGEETRPAMPYIKIYFKTYVDEMLWWVSE